MVPVSCSSNPTFSETVTNNRTECTDSGAPITIPVGPATLGRIMNVTGDPIDERGPIKTDKFLPIHADPPEFVEQSTSAEVLVTGIKVVDLLAPYARGGKIGLFGGAGVGKTVFIQELIVSTSKLMHLAAGQS